jgi:hypothetical protein
MNVNVSGVGVYGVDEGLDEANQRGARIKRMGPAFENPRVENCPWSWSV